MVIFLSAAQPLLLEQGGPPDLLCWSLARCLSHIVTQAPAPSLLLLITTGPLRGWSSLPAPNAYQQERTAVLSRGTPCSTTTSFKRWIGRQANGCVNKRAPGITKSHRQAQSQGGMALNRADGSVDRRGEDGRHRLSSETELALSRESFPRGLRPRRRSPPHPGHASPPSGED